VKQFIRSIAVLLISAVLMQGVCAQAITGKGFLPDENGTNLDDPQASKTIQQKVSPGTIIKDCAECPEMVVIPAGSFVIGSDKSSDEQPTHSVNLRSFSIGKYEVTQEQWFAVMGYNSSANKGRTLPVAQVSWNDTQQFIEKLNQKTGQKYRLPSEAEWEYAARAGTTTEWSFGNDESKLGNYAWHGRNSGGKTQEVGQKQPNAFGLYDMHGNVWEWTQDCWHDNYIGAPTDGSVWTAGCSGNYRVLRGGSWLDFPAGLRSAVRGGGNPGSRGNFSGFRLARTP
jgi:formylglycine-generating enzyme required for sulfatase activity